MAGQRKSFGFPGKVLVKVNLRLSICCTFPFCNCLLTDAAYNLLGFALALIYLWVEFT